MNVTVRLHLVQRDHSADEVSGGREGPALTGWMMVGLAAWLLVSDLCLLLAPQVWSGSHHKPSRLSMSTTLLQDLGEGAMTQEVQLRRCCCGPWVSSGDSPEVTALLGSRLCGTD